MSNQIGDGPVQPEYVAQMRAVAETLDEFLNGTQAPKQIGFVVLMFPFHDHQGRCNYMSNANREDVVVMLKEQLARFEGRAMPEAST